MEIQTTQTQDTTPTAAPEAPQATSTPAVESSATSSTAQASAAGKEGFTPDAAAASAAYTPNLKFSVADKEFEFDKEIVPLLKDKTTEEKFRELYTKAYGIDFVKSRLNDTKESYQKLKKEYESFQPIKAVYNDAQTFLKNKDFDSLFEMFKIPDEEVFRYVHNKLEMREMPPMQQQEYLRQRELQKRAYDLEKQNQTLQETYYNEVVQAKHNQLDSELSKPEVKDFITSFDARVGKPGAFKDEVITRGVLHFQRTGKDISIQEAMNEVLSLAGYTPQQQAQMMNNQMAASPQVSQNPAPVEKPVVKPTIPNVSGKGTSPVKTSPKNLDDLRKLAANF